MRQILEQILDRATDEDEQWRPSLSVLRDAWPGLVGDRIAAVTRLAAVNWQDASLTVEVASENWRDELQRHDHQLIKRLRQVLPWDIRRLEFQVGMLETVHHFQTGDSENPQSGGEGQRDAGDAADETNPDGGTLPAEETSEGEVEQTLESLDDSTADTARRILEHVRNHDHS